VISVNTNQAINDQNHWSLPSPDAVLDDPLLGCLVVVTRLQNRPFSPESLTAGLPLVHHRLTPELFVRAAARVGISSQITKCPLDAISNLVLPAVLLLAGKRACVLVEKTEDGLARCIQAESGFGIAEIELATLEKSYTGYAIFAKPAYRFEARVEQAAAPQPKHWCQGALRGSWKIYGEVLVASLLINLFALAAPLFTMNVYDRVVPNHALETLWVLSIGAIIVFGFDLLMRTLRGYFLDVAGKKADVTLSANVFEKVLGMRMASRPASVGAFAANVQEFESLREFMTSATMTAVVDLPFVFLFIVMIAWIGGPLAWVPALCMPLVIAFALLLQSPLAAAVGESQRLAAARQATLVEALAGLETLKTLRGEGPMQRKWEQIIGSIARLGLKSRLLSGLTVNFAGFAQQVGYVVIVIFGVYLIAREELTLGGLIACTLLMGRVLAPLAQLANLVTRFHQTKAAMQTLNKLMDLPVERPAGKSFLSRPNLAGEIEFKEVAFAYHGAPVPALDGVSFRIAPGERVGIIGRIGSGKTTIEKLILGLHAPASGAVLVDGTDLRQIDPAELRRQIGYVPQDILLFYGSVKDNIALAAPYADDATVLRAAEIAGVTEFVNRHPQGFDMQVGERGEGLSGGQRQAVAIARALLLDAPIVLLDEPTSAMDNRSEEQFQARLAASLGARTLVLITHKASMLTLVDRLIVLDGGRVVADGLKGKVLNALAGGKISVAKQ
jgi:ATP-binding cassette, subfamily C, bacterial LapB